MRAPRRERLPNWFIGLFLVVAIAIGSMIAYTKELPWADRYEVTAIFESGQKLRPSNPVRIAGVNVGEVTWVELLGEDETDATVATTADALDSPEGGGVAVTMALDEDALPLHEDALFKVRPRLFLEGNYFIDVQPGSPSAPVVAEDHTFPVNRTSYSVQLDQVLTTLQYDVRQNLQTLLQEFGSALSVHGGADGLRKLNMAGPNLQYSAQVAESTRGTQEGDLSGMISGLSKVLGGLSKSESDLRELVTNFRIFTGSFAAESEALGRAVQQLPQTLRAAQPVFDNLNASFPFVRAFAREALPGVKTSPESLRASRPFIEQLRLLTSPPELQGLVADLRPTVPACGLWAARTSTSSRRPARSRPASTRWSSPGRRTRSSRSTRGTSTRTTPTARRCSRRARTGSRARRSRAAPVTRTVRTSASSAARERIWCARTSAASATWSP